MKKKLIFSGMLIGLLAFGLTVAACGGDDGGGGVPTELQHKWKNFTTSRTCEFTETQLSDGGDMYDVSVSGNTITINGGMSYANQKFTAKYAISSIHLTISESNAGMLPNGSYQRN
jgi:hypothetical protein